MRFIFINAVATALSLIAFALFIVSFSTPWYYTSLEFSNYNPSSGATEISGQTRINRTLTEYDVSGVTQELTVGTSGTSTQLSNFDWGADDVDGDVENVFHIIESFLIIGVLFTVLLLIILVSQFFRLVQSKLLPFPQKFWRFILFFLAFMAFVGGFIAFFELMAMPGALKKDISGCSAGYCRKFQGTEQDKIDTSGNGTVDAVLETSWGPSVAFFTTLVAYIVLIPVAFIVLINRIPAAEFGEEEETGVAL
jgi:magnesium-transporting ATPase (P-type)